MTNKELGKTVTDVNGNTIDLTKEMGVMMTFGNVPEEEKGYTFYQNGVEAFFEPKRGELIVKAMEQFAEKRRKEELKNKPRVVVTTVAKKI